MMRVLDGVDSCLFHTLETRCSSNMVRIGRASASTAVKGKIDHIATIVSVLRLCHKVRVSIGEITRRPTVDEHQQGI